MDFTLIIRKIPVITKKDINLGKYSTELSVISSFFRHIFLLSNSIRKDNNLTILCTEQFESGDKCLYIVIRGNSLRYLAPDEKNSLFLIQKILGVIYKTSNAKIYKNQINNFQNNKWANSTPGINFKRCVSSQFLQNMENKNLFLFNINNNPFKKIKNHPIEQITSIGYLSEVIKKTSDSVILIGHNLDFINDLLGCYMNYKINPKFYYENDLAQNFFTWELILIFQAIYSEIDIDHGR